MLMADLHNKAPEIENMEDILTSQVFGILKYLDTNDVLYDILSDGCNFRNTTKHLQLSSKIVESKYYFWPKLTFIRNVHKYRKEPDIIIILKLQDNSTVAVAIEVKYYSHKHNIENEDNDQLSNHSQVRDQLAEELYALNNLYESSYRDLKQYLDDCTEKYLVYLTKHEMPPNDDIKETENSLFEYGNLPLDRFFWISWNNVAEIITKRKTNQVMLKDLSDLLNKKGLKKYLGYKVLLFDDIKVTEKVYFFKEKLFWQIDLNGLDLVINYFGEV